MELPGLLDRQIETLSKGMSQKVQFVAAVVSNPSLLILDEPFSGLDPVNAQVLKDAVLEMRRRGTTVVFSTHDMATAERMCDRIFMIFRGRKVLDGSLESIQDEYGADTVRIRTSAGAAALTGLPEVEAVNDFGQMQEVRVTGDPQAFLARLAARTSVYHFEVTRPSLQDIFVRIAETGELHAHAQDLIVAQSEFATLVRTQGVPHRPPAACRSSWRRRSCWSRATKDATDTKDRTFAIVDYTGVVAEPLKARRRAVQRLGAARPMAAVLPRNGARFIPVEIKPDGRRPDELRLDLSDRVRARGALRVRRDARRTCSIRRPTRRSATTPTIRLTTRCRSGFARR